MAGMKTAKLLEYSTLSYFTIFVTISDILGPQTMGYCSSCEGDAGLQNCWFFIRPEACVHCGAKFSERAITWESCVGRYEYADRLSREWREEQIRQLDEVFSVDPRSSVRFEQHEVSE